MSEKNKTKTKGYKRNALLHGLYARDLVLPWSPETISKSFTRI